MDQQPGRGAKRNFDVSQQFDVQFHDRVAGHKFSDLIFVEVFSGTAGLTAAVRRLGCHQATGVDAHVTKQVKSPVIRIDLSSESGQTLLWRILAQPRVFAIHLGPPCGTSSRAREIKRKHGVNPKPMRSVEHPDGLPGLRPHDQARVNTANTLYKLCGDIMAYSTANGIICSIENPARSHMWDTSFLRQGLQRVQQDLHTVLFHHCMFGSKRKKRTKLLVNHPCLQHLNRDCDQSHQHEAWGYTSHGWATSLEVEYPHALCRAWASCLQQVALQQCATALPQELTQDDGMNLNLQAKASLGVPVRGKRLKPLMREHSQTITITGPQDVLLALPHKIQKAIALPSSCRTSPLPNLALPEQAKQIRAPLLLQGGVAGQKDDGMWQVEYGIPWQPMEFVKRASGLSHPGHFLDGLHDVLKSLMDKLATTAPHVVAMEGTAAMRKWSMRFAELKSKGINGLDDPPAHAKEVLGGKNMVLFAEMVKASGSPDLGIAGDISKGFDLMGSMPSGGIFPKKPLYATLMPEQWPLLPGRLHGMQSNGRRMMRCAKTSTVQLWRSAQEVG